MLARWRAAVEPRLPAPAGSRGTPPLVLDVGAGTGIFTRAWRDWGSRIVAVEPSRAMRDQHVELGLGGPLLAARAEQLPLADGCVDVAWLSAVVHHVHVEATCAELRRVVRRGGRVMVRGLFRDRGQVPWLAPFPGRARALGGFPDVAPLVDVFERMGFVVLDLTDVEDAGGRTRGEVADWLENMRGADSLLVKLEDDEIDAGLATLRADPDRPLPPVVLVLATFERL